MSLGGLELLVFRGWHGLTPASVTHNFYLWQLVTYIFLHDTGQWFHILFNMLGLWMFGSELERSRISVRVTPTVPAATPA